MRSGRFFCYFIELFFKEADVADFIVVQRLEDPFPIGSCERRIASE